MGRVSQAQARENRQRIVETAARLFRERGIAGVSVADVMAEVGLTHGGFYKHFASKEALVAEAVGQAFEQAGERLTAESREDFVRGYLSPEHRDGAGDGCPAAGFGGDLAHGDFATAVEGYAQGVDLYARELGSLADVATLVGALVLARATAGTAVSDRVLEAARKSLIIET
ncbi:TetR/AcrR family transcriptional regulator [Microlunatus sp. Gsoil 973]|uniref:TetR/AcrR family transcriptional regulator n=1 Tax=Microlunatus sp. Gsoil 973 TaxID=2672569 RepID=UPI0012B4CDA1|nr:TetR family transcriptional regulator [Microlunatus sp. Gsoil 973]QGN32237.1 TetR family transcriptional regulator [Microlunatus sp. Gsoil 973]